MFRTFAPRVYSAFRSATESVLAEDFALAIDAGALEDRILFNAALPVDGTVEGELDTADSSGGWLLEEEYSGETADQHDTQSGGWDVVDGEYVATPGSDAITTLQLAQPLPDNLELAVTVSADPPSSEYLTNAFVIFDYHGPTDFKFAGGYMGVDQWVIGHRTADDWVTDAWVWAPLDPLNDYQLGVRITGDSQITLSADGMPVLTHTYADSLTDGDLGLGTKNAVARYDDLRVRALVEDVAGTPGELQLTDDFDDSAAEHFSPEVGTWLLVNGQYEVSPDIGGDGASVLVLSEAVPDDVEVSVTFEANEIIPHRFSNGVIIFDYHSSTDFKYAGGFVNNDQWVIGQRTDQGWVDTLVMPGTLDAFTTYDVQLLIQNGSDVTLTAGGQPVLSHSFAESVTDGALGLGSKNSVTRFDDFSVVDLTVTPEPIPEPEPPVSNIVVELVGRDLVITGDATGQLEIVAQGRDSFQILDNGEVLYDFNKVRGDLRIELAGGDDNLKLNLGGHKFKHDVIVDLGDGANQLQVAGGTIAGRLVIHGGSEQDNVTLGDDLHVRRDVRVNLGDGTNQFQVADARLGGHLKYQGGSGEDQVTIADDARLDGHAVVKLGDGANQFDLADARVDGHLKVHGGDHQDVFTIHEDAVLRKHARLWTGDGEDSVVFAGTARNLVVNMGDDDDTLLLAGSVWAGVHVHMGDGNDHVEVASTDSLGKTAKIKLGDGDDSFSGETSRRSHMVKGGSGDDSIEIVDNSHHRHEHHRKDHARNLRWV